MKGAKPKQADAALDALLAKLESATSLTPEEAHAQGYRSPQQIAEKMGMTKEATCNRLRKLNLPTVRVRLGNCGQRQVWFRAK